MTLTQINRAGLDAEALDRVFTIGASGSSAYTFQGEGLNGTVNNPTLYLTRGKTYRFENGSGGHPIRIQSTSGASGTAYNTGVTNNAGSGTVIVEVQHDAPDVLYYQCTSHAAMNGILYITGALPDGGVTTAKIADDAVTDAKLANSINAAIAANTAKTSNATHTGDVTGSTALTIANDAVTQAKIAANAVDTTELAVGAVTHDQLADNTVDADHLQSNAVTTAKIADGAVSNNKLQDNSIVSGKLADSGVNSGSYGSATAIPAITINNKGQITAASTNNVNIPTGTTINNQADHRLITCTGTADTLNGESTLTFDNSNNILISGSGYALANIGGHISGSGGGQDHISIKDSAGTERFVVKTHGTHNGKVGIGMTNPDDTLDVNGTFHVSSNAYVSGSLYALGNDIRIGGTGTGNSLDDYEEGSWTPNVASNGSGSYSSRNGYYTKIGNIVHLSFLVNVSGVSYGVNYFRLGGVPFTCNGWTCGSFMSHSHTMNNNRWYSLYLEANDTNILAYGSEANAAWEVMSADSQFSMVGQITYRTDS